MPPPRPRSMGCSTGTVPLRPSPNTPMSERQQMALLIQMTATSSDHSRSQIKKSDHKKCGDLEETNLDDKTEVKEISLCSTLDEVNSDCKKDLNFEHVNIFENVANTNKRSFSDVDEDEFNDCDDNKKKKRKESEIKHASSLRIPKIEKNAKPAVPLKNVPSSSKINILSEKEQYDIKSNKLDENEIDEYELKVNESIYSGGLKVPPLKIVIPQQNCTIDTDGAPSRTGKINNSRTAALPYVVSSNNESSDREVAMQYISPNDSPIKTSNSCAIVDEKMNKVINEEKNLRVLRSSHRVGISNHERSSNNSSPQMQSNSPSPASLIVNDSVEGKLPLNNITTSPVHQNQLFEPDAIVNLSSPSTSSTSSLREIPGNNVELHPRKRKIKSKNDDSHMKSNFGSNASNDTHLINSDSHPHDLPFTNCFQMYLNIRKQIERKYKNLFSVKPRPPQGYNEFLINKKKYLLSTDDTIQIRKIPSTISSKMRDIFLIQEKERNELYQRHTVEKEKLCLNVEQEIIRVHSKAARNISCQLLPYSVCTFIKDQEIYNIITPEQDEKDKNARYRFNGRLLLSWLQDVDDKWEKIKESMVLRHHNEAESLHAVQLMDWEIALKKCELYDLKSQLIIDKEHVPIVHVNDDFELLPV